MKFPTMGSEILFCKLLAKKMSSSENVSLEQALDIIAPRMSPLTTNTDNRKTAKFCLIVEYVLEIFLHVNCLNFSVFTTGDFNLFCFKALVSITCPPFYNSSICNIYLHNCQLMIKILF